MTVGLLTVASTLCFLQIAALGWGGWAGLLAQPARAAAVAMTFGLGCVGAFSGFSLGPGRRGGREGLGFLVAALLGSVLLAWLPPSMDRRGVWTFDGDGVRWVGVALLVVGGPLRVWPMFVLGRRFSPFVAIQHGHELVTEGPYRVIRHPSYVGGIVWLVGWALVFRSGMGLAFAVAAVWMIVVRIGAEEELLAAEFGERWAAYRRRTWRLVPFVY